MARVTIGVNTGDYQGASLRTSINDALSDGHRWLVFLQGGNLDGPISLDPFGGGSLRLEAAGPYINQLNRGYDPSLGPMLYAYNTGWDLHFTGLSFADINATSSGATPLCEFRNVGGSYFKACSWVDSRGGGLKIGATQAAIITMIAPRFMANRSYGLFIDGGVCISLAKPMAEWNDDVGQQPHIRLRGQSGYARGSGIIMGIHSERNAIRPGLVIERWRGLRLQNGDLMQSHVILASDASENIVESMSLRGCDITNNGPNNIDRYNTRADAQGH